MALICVSGRQNDLFTVIEHVHTHNIRLGRKHLPIFRGLFFVRHDRYILLFEAMISCDK